MDTATQFQVKQLVLAMYVQGAVPSTIIRHARACGVMPKVTRVAIKAAHEYMMHRITKEQYNAVEV